jgi:hypothetical protein
MRLSEIFLGKGASTLHTRLSPAEVRRILDEFTSPPFNPTRGIWKFPTKKYVGHVRDDGFRIRRTLEYSSSHPYVKGTMRQTDRGTEIAIFTGADTVALLATLVWTALMFVAFIYIAMAGLPRIVFLAPVVGLVGGVLTHLAFGLLRAHERKAVVRELQERCSTSDASEIARIE